MNLTLIQTKNEMKRIDNPIKIIILLILDAYFDFIGSLRRYYLNKLLKSKNSSLKSLKSVEMRIRSREIFFQLYYVILPLKLNFINII